MSLSPDPVVLAEAIRLLSQRNLSSDQLRSRLAKKFAEGVDPVIAHVQARGLVQDEAVAERIARKADLDGRGDEWIQAQLESLGLASCRPALSEVERAKVALGKKMSCDPGRYLAGRGFTTDAIASIIEELDGD